MNKDPKLMCLVVDLESREGLTVSWQWGKAGSLTPDPLKVTEQLNGTYTALSTLPIAVRDWDAGERYICKVENPELVIPMTKAIARQPGKGETGALLHPKSSGLISKQSLGQGF